MDEASYPAPEQLVSACLDDPAAFALKAQDWSERELVANHATLAAVVAAVRLGDHDVAGRRLKDDEIRILDELVAQLARRLGM